LRDSNLQDFSLWRRDFIQRRTPKDAPGIIGTYKRRLSKDALLRKPLRQQMWLYLSGCVRDYRRQKIPVRESRIKISTKGRLGNIDKKHGKTSIQRWRWETGTYLARIGPSTLL